MKTLFRNPLKFFYLTFALVLILTASHFFPKKHHLLIVGCARSGTAYTAKVLNELGLQIGHEKMGRDGIIFWHLTPKIARSEKYSKHNQFEHIFHQVRDPLKVISSVYVTEDRNSWSFITKYLPQIKVQDSHLVKCAKYWYYWNLEAEKIAEWTYRLEEIDDHWEEFEKHIGKKLKRANVKVRKDTNTWQTGNYRTFTWQDLKTELDPELFENIQKLALKYGYSTEL